MGEGWLTLAQDALSRPEALDPAASLDRRLDALAAQAAGGDKLAFELLYQYTVDDIYGYLVGQTRDPAMAEDLTANVFLKAWGKARSYRAGSNRYRRWLFTIAHNELRDSWRRQQQAPQLALLTQAAAQPDLTNDEAQDEYTRVMDALGSLNEEQRRLIVLRFFAGQSHAEIAAILKKREGAVRSQLLRSLRHLRKVLNDASP